ncbi:MAG: hypothetical protein KatS3mg081_2157 [Gemmatimonadales bacterium]|nr:MAG: hypothetical protein KatS3mg081_2157 [Gemmatimonadales bacterium]
MLVTAYRLLPEWGRPQGFFFRMLLISVVPPVALFGASAAVRKMFSGEGGVGADVSLRERRACQWDA